jgi:hypothetical protein
LGIGNVSSANGDCEIHRKVKEHEKKRVLADGGTWDDSRNRAVET